MRINKFIAKTGLASRRKSEEYIKKGLKILKIQEKFYYKLNKPLGYISSNYDPHNKKDLNELIKIDGRFFCAGRLDKDSHGLMLITNDGNITNKIIHPSKEINKTYLVRVDKILSKAQEEKFKNSIKLSENEITSKAKISLIDKNQILYKVIIHQGYNRQVRRMFSYFGVKVLDLKRIKIGEIELGNLEDGAYKKLSQKEFEYLESL